MAPTSPDEVVLFVGRQRGQEATESRTRSRARRPTTTHPAPAPAPRPDLTTRVAMGTGPGGRRCVQLWSAPGRSMGWAGDANEVRAIQWLSRFPSCSSLSVPAAAPAGPTTTPAAAAAEVWRRQVRLPTPALALAPGFAVTGRPAYLEVVGPRQVSGTYQALGRPVHIEARATLDLDWGDGWAERGIQRLGGPWPDGDIVHTYTTAGTHTLTATLRWTAWWRVGKLRGVISEPLATTASLAVEARSLEAVRDR